MENKMTDIKPADDKQKGNPIESAVNKIKESVSNDLNKKILDKVKEINSANKVAKTLKDQLKELVKENEVEKLELSELLKELK